METVDHFGADIFKVRVVLDITPDILYGLQECLYTVFGRESEIEFESAKSL
jgi:hypothetical protein